MSIYGCVFDYSVVRHEGRVTEPTIILSDLFPQVGREV